LLLAAGTAFADGQVKVDVGAKIVPAGVAEIARLQAKEGFAYLKP
jgi:intracellular sulfur oxidation DsrE/DsrF family protein